MTTQKPPYVKTRFTMAKVAAEATKAQDIMGEVLAVCKKQTGLRFERIPDSKSAGYGRGGNLLKGRRGDFDGILNGKYFIIEVKNSLTHANFKGVNINSAFQPAQLSAAVNWGGQGALCLSFLRSSDGGWWGIKTAYLVHCLANGRKSCDVTGDELPTKADLVSYIRNRLVEFDTTDP